MSNKSNLTYMNFFDENISKIRYLNPEDEAQAKANTEKMVNDFSKKSPIFTKEVDFDPFEIEYAIDYLDRIKDLKFNDDEANTPEHIKLFFEDDYEFEIAGLLLIDGLLPVQAREAYVQCVFNAQVCLSDKKVVCEELFVQPNKRGRKSIKDEMNQRIKSVQKAINSGASITESYQLVATKYNKSVDTIRRSFERYKKNQVEVEIRLKTTYVKKPNGEVIESIIYPKKPNGE